MSETPQVWHYGLVARWWAEFNNDGPEIEHFRSFIDQFGEPALDAACGTGRLLLAYLRTGLDVDGCDISQDMLDFCREKASLEGLSTSLHRQALHELDLPRKYRTIIMCGGFGLGGSRRQDQEALIRLRHQLQRGGRLVFDSYLPYNNEVDEWRYWTKEEMQKLPEPWPKSGSRKQTEDGDEIEIRTRLAALDPLLQVVTREIHVMLWREGKLIRQEESTLRECLYFQNEVLDMLRIAGFQTEQVLADYTEKTAAADSRILTYIAAR